MEDSKKINYSLHTVYQTGLAITGVMLFSFSLGMVQPNSVKGASSSQIASSLQKSSSASTKDVNSPVSTINSGDLDQADSQNSLDSNLSTDKNKPTVTENNNWLHFSFTFDRKDGTDTPFIKKGDQFKVQFSDISGIQFSDFRYTASEVEPPTVDLSGLFDFKKEGNTLTVTATQDMKAVKRVVLGLDGRTQSTSTDNAVTATSSFDGQMVKTNPQNYYFKNSKSSNNPVAQNTDIAIFGHYTGGALHSTRDNNPSYSDNFWANDSGNKLYFWHSQNAMVAYAQLSLPYDNKIRPTKVKDWKIELVNDQKHELLSRNARVEIAPNDKPNDYPFDMMGSGNHPNYTYQLIQDADGKSLDFSSSNLPPRNGNSPSDPQPTINITFYIDTEKDPQTGPSDTIHLRTSCLTDRGSIEPKDYTLSYIPNGQYGFSPLFTAKDDQVDLSTAVGKSFPGTLNDLLKMDSNTIKNDFVKAGSAGDYDDPDGSNYSYKIVSVEPSTSGTSSVYEKKNGNSYNVEIEATKNSGGEYSRGNTILRNATLTFTGSSSGGGGSTPVTPVNPVNPVTPDTPSSSSSSSSSSTSSSSSSSVASSSSSVSTPSEPSERPTFPDYVAKKGMAVYSLKKIGLYSRKNFSTKARKAWYSRKPRVYRPMFVVTGYARSSVGHLRYKVRDVNHLTKNRNKKGYITANWKYVRPVYYAKKHSTVTMINPRGVNAYKKVNLTNEVKHYKQGTVLKVAKAVHYHLTTRYILPNGRYITANRKLVKMGRHHFPKYVRARSALNRYSDVNLNKRNHHYSKRSHKLFKVYGFDYSHANSVSDLGALRYRVAHGYISGNSRLVRVIR
ncbi:DUF5776 domain-containing protein [Lentilactobacillus raoultii]|uniref:DUF5776 domain-containing protein n=1 Tax=Lentilactobacillus raoultii TaxID=1987503 RepID=A0ABW3PJ90_9LACO|nr:DUF5776 domain-containing protein [Lentilactobacillus raoultii]